MNEDINKEELIFRIDIKARESLDRYRSKKAVKSAEKNLKKMFLNRLNGKTGEC